MKTMKKYEVRVNVERIKEIEAESYDEAKEQADLLSVYDPDDWDENAISPVDVYELGESGPAVKT